MGWRLASACLFAAAFFALATGCNDNKEEYTYEFEEDGCNTGKHTFNSKDAYCRALADHALNNYCAPNLRRQTFEANCPGYTWPDSEFYYEEYWSY